jgi:hypothetical protein
LIVIIGTVISSLIWIFKTITPRLEKWRARKAAFYANAVEALAFGENMEGFIRDYWNYGKPLRNYPLARPESLCEDEAIGEDARAISRFYQEFCEEQGCINGKTLDDALSLWRQTYQPFVKKLREKFRSTWRWQWDRRWKDAVRVAEAKSRGPLEDQRLAIAEGRQ